MADDSKSVLDAIAADHAKVVNLIDGRAQSTQDRVEGRLDRVEADLGTFKPDVRDRRTDERDLKFAVGGIESKFNRHETRIEALEAQS